MGEKSCRECGELFWKFIICCWCCGWEEERDRPESMPEEELEFALDTLLPRLPPPTTSLKPKLSIPPPPLAFKLLDDMDGLEKRNEDCWSSREGPPGPEERRLLPPSEKGVEDSSSLIKLRENCMPPKPPPLLLDPITDPPPV